MLSLVRLSTKLAAPKKCIPLIRVNMFQKFKKYKLDSDEFDFPTGKTLSYRSPQWFAFETQLREERAMRQVRPHNYFAND
jgi:hypothetical protein